jgi:hypothetical protein
MKFNKFIKKIPEASLGHIEYVKAIFGFRKKMRIIAKIYFLEIFYQISHNKRQNQ